MRHKPNSRNSNKRNNRYQNNNRGNRYNNGQQSSRPSRLKRCLIHPISEKMIRQGHPWVTKDKFTEDFPGAEERFFIAKNKYDKPIALMLNDPGHKNVKARVWAKSGDFDKQAREFKRDITDRINKAVQKRSSLQVGKDRENYYIIFGEADQLPGLFVQKLANNILIQFYAFYWNDYKDHVITTLKKNLLKLLEVDEDEDILPQWWFQSRSESYESQVKPVNLDPMTSFASSNINEFGVKYKVTIGKFYDHGIYTDMASIRPRLLKYINENSSVLNLYCYTGAFSLYALKNNAREVHSVDLSEEYLEWLNENLALNEDLDSSKHTNVCESSLDSLKKYSKEDKKFDLVICDPPSSSFDGDKRQSALKQYEELLPATYDVLEDQGSAVFFLNTHSINVNKFNQALNNIIKNNKLESNFIFQEKLYMGKDCPHLKGFPEGSYIKGIVFKKDLNPTPKVKDEEKEETETNSNVEEKEVKKVAKKKVTKKATKKKQTKKKVAKKKVTKKKVAKKDEPTNEE